ncbi:phosphonoacetaldehyde hydrolase [Geobacillus sp. G4]|uniref:phosphonoacetaldehyde hydrolase n=1 Tax=Geobacillus sp. G4 TaxID=3169691 RepID=UPI00333AD2C9
MIKAVVFDWAGTVVDYGCFAPLEALRRCFFDKGINVSVEEIRSTMGISKLEHIRSICGIPHVQEEWKRNFGRTPTDSDVMNLYREFENILIPSLQEFSKPIDGVAAIVEKLRKKGVKIGSTTGYTSEMIEVVASEAEKYGYKPDCIVTSSDVSAGRPFPWMIYQNAINLEVFPMHHIVKVGDTVSDILEGINAGVWTVGVIKGGNELGMTKEEVEACDLFVLQEKIKNVRETFRDAGAHYVIEEISELERVIDDIHGRLSASERPV